MNELLDTSNILAHPVTRVGVVAIAIALVATPLITLALSGAKLMGEKTRKDVWTRYFTWLVLAPLMVGGLILCPLATILAVLAMSLLCYREYARATGLFREHLLSTIVVLAICTLAFASADNWYRLYVALPPLALTFLAATAVLKDQPQGFIQRVSLSAVGFLLFGSGLGYLGFISNDPNFRPILIILVMSAQLSDIAAYCVGKAIGKRKLFPNTSPNKTLGGHLGALLIIAPLAAYAAHLVFPDTALDDPLHLAGFGLVIAAGAQLGDLVLGSIKRDIGIKDMASTLPGHGGFLDRFNSLLLIAPAAFYYLNYLGVLHFPATLRFGGAAGLGSVP